MTDFFDTSVLVAAFQVNHVRHEECHRTFARARRAACSLHTLAEFYSTTTGFPRPARLTTDEAGIFVEEIIARCRLIALTADEYVDTIRRLAQNRQSGGRTFDALLLQCARKAEAGKIYTLNLQHFRELAPDLAKRIVAP
ncbi:MAG: PIN domain-containing protein [Acidobacteriaceae bacterium]